MLYDPLGRLYESQNFSCGVASGTVKYLRDGDALVAEFDTSGNLTARHLHGPNAGVDDPLVSYESPYAASAYARFLQSDARGSVVYRSDKNDANRSVNTYDEYGQPSANNTGRFQYTGQVWLPELGMFYYKARIYSPRLGRFMQTDPIGYEDNVNLYGYGGQDPINMVDPTGTKIILAEEGREETLGRINELSMKQYVTNDSGELSASDDVNENGSSLYSDFIDQGIASENTGTITQDPNAIVFGKPIDSSLVGGGANIGFTGEDQSVIVSGNGFVESGLDSNGDFIIVDVTPAEVLMHELVEHTVPSLMGETPGARIGLSRDNAVRQQLGRPQRPPQPMHPTTVRRIRR